MRAPDVYLGRDRFSRAAVANYLLAQWVAAAV